MKKLLSIMLAVMMVASLFAINASAMIVPETYSITTGAHDEAVYVDQDFSNIEANADLTTNTTGWGNVTVTDGVLNFTGAEGESPSQNVGAITCNTPITYGEFKVSFDLRKNHEMSDEMGFYTAIMRAENADNANLSKYGAMVPINTLEKDTWYEYELTFSESAFNTRMEKEVAEGVDPKSYTAPNIIATAKRRVKGTETWSNLGHYGGWIITNDTKFRSNASGMTTLSTGVELQMFVKSYNGVKSEGYSNSDINVSLDNVKAWAPATEGITTVYDYPVNSENILYTNLDGVTVPSYTATNNTWNYTYTTTPSTLAEGKTKTMVFSFDAKNTGLGMPMLIHLSGSAKTTGFDILSRDEIFNKWYTYKVVANETAANLSIQKIFRKEAGSTAPYEEYDCRFVRNVTAGTESEQTVAGWWNNKDCTNAKFLVNGCLSSGVGNIRFGYGVSRDNNAVTGQEYSEGKTYGANAINNTISYPGMTTEQLMANTAWEVRDVQVVETASAVTGTATLADGVLTADLAMVTSEASATAVLAVYDADNRLVDASAKTLAIGEGNVELSANYATGNTAKIFVWKTLDEPLLHSEVLDITAAIQ